MRARENKAASQQEPKLLSFLEACHLLLQFSYQQEQSKHSNWE